MRKKYRLKRSNEIGKIVLKKQKVNSELYTVYYIYNKEETKIAIVAGKKCGNAVQRNYEKRIMREIVRPYISNLKRIHAVIVAKEKVLNISFTKKKETLEKILGQLLERIRKNEKN